MAKSPIANLKITKPQPRQNVTDMALNIPTKTQKNTLTGSTNLIHLSHLHCDEAQPRISGRFPYLRDFCKWANDAVQYGSLSVITISAEYQLLKQYICYCDTKSIDPFSSEGYFAYVGNDGELWRQVRLYNPQKKFLFQYDDGQELGIKENSAHGISSAITSALQHCKFDSLSLRNQCKPFVKGKRNSDVLPYHPSEQATIVERMSSAFFVLAAELLAHKTLDIAEFPEVIEVPIVTNGGVEYLEYQTGLANKHSGVVNIAKGIIVNHEAAFNQCMAMAYHLVCYFTSLNDSVIRQLCHPIKVETDNREKSLKTVTISGYKKRANKRVDAVFSNELDNIAFDVDKRDGVTFISTLAELSLLYAGDGNENARLLYELDSNGQVANIFDINGCNKKLVTRLHLLSHTKTDVVDWIITCFRSLVKSQKSYSLGTMRDENGRTIVTKKLESSPPTRTTWRIHKYAFAALSCLTDVSLKNITLPLTYQEKDGQGNVTVSFNYLEGTMGEFTVAAKYQSFLEDIEAWAIAHARKKSRKPKYLIPIGGADGKIKQWRGLAPLTYGILPEIGLGQGNFYLELSSRRFRKTTSNEEYSDTNLSHLINLLQNELATLQTHYLNGDPNLNKLIISQAIKVLQRIAKGDSLDDAKLAVCHEMKIEMLAHDKWLKSKEVSNPNGLHCNGEQYLTRGKKRQRETNKALGVDLPCSEFDMCYLCKSAKGIDEPNSVYKLISFTDLLKEALDRYPDAKSEVKEKIAAFESILLGASDDVYEDAMNRFNSNGRHPRVSMNHVKVSTKGVF